MAGSLVWGSMTEDELQATALAALQSADAAVLSRMVMTLLPLALRDIERRRTQADRKGRSRKSRAVTGQDATSHTPPSPPFPPLLSPTPPNNPSLPSPSPELPTLPDAPRGAHEAEFAHPDHLTAYRQFVVAGGVVVDGGLRSVTQGMGARAVYDWPVVGAALVEMAANGAKFTVEGCRAYCRRLVTPDRADHNRSNGSRQDRNLAAIAEGLRRHGGTNGES